MSSTLDVTLGFDDGFAPHAAATIASAVKASPGADFRFIIFHAGVSRERQESVEAAAPGATFFWRELRDDEMPSFTNRGYFNKAIMFRLGLEAFGPEDCTRAIYLDADTIVLRDLRELWNTDLEGAPLGAVLDTYSTGAEFAERWNLPAENPIYFNSGMLLINLKQVREEKLFSRAIEFFVENDEHIHFADQDALNYAVWGRWKKLDNCWNVQRDMIIPGLAANLPEEMRWDGSMPGVVHFTGTDKPWSTDGWHPWSWTYWRALERTPFAREVAQRRQVPKLHRLRLLLRWLRHKPRSAG